METQREMQVELSTLLIDAVLSEEIDWSEVDINITNEMRGN